MKKKVLAAVGILVLALLIVFSVFWFKPRTLFFPDKADHTVVLYGGVTYELDEEKSQELLEYLKGIEIQKGHMALQPYPGGMELTFYFGEEMLQKLYISSAVYSYEPYPVKHAYTEDIWEFMGDFLQENVLPDGIANIVDSFYESGYDYERTEIYVRDGKESGVIFEGQVFADPYREHVTVSTFGDTTSSWTEAYYEEKRGTVTMTMTLADGSTAKQTGKRSYPYGYDEDIVFTEAEAGTLDGEEVQIYHGEYTVDMGAVYGFEAIEAVVAQTYYVRTEDNVLVQIDTDLSEQNRALAIATNMSVNGDSREEAEEKAVSDENTETVTLKIKNLGNPTDWQ